MNEQYHKLDKLMKRYLELTRKYISTDHEIVMKLLDKTMDEINHVKKDIYKRLGL